MKKIINFINKNKLIILAITLTLIVIKGGVDAATSIAGTNVTYKDNYSLGATTVQAAVDKLCSKVSNIDTRVTNLEEKNCFLYQSKKANDSVALGFTSRTKMVGMIFGAWSNINSYNIQPALTTIGAGVTTFYMPVLRDSSGNPVNSGVNKDVVICWLEATTNF